MPWTASYTRRRNGFNIVATITYTDGKTTIAEEFPGVDLTGATIAERARARIQNVLEVGDAALVALQGGPITIPDAPDNTAPQAVAAANAKLGAAVRNAQLRALNDQDVNAALDELDAAQAVVAQSAGLATVKG